MLKQFFLVLMLTHAILASEIFDDCDAGVAVVLCASDPCEKVVSTMKCRTNMCGGCVAECFNEKKMPIDCVLAASTMSDITP